MKTRKNHRSLQEILICLEKMERAPIQKKKNDLILLQRIHAVVHRLKFQGEKTVT